jgi:hypothetical protein
MRRIGKFTYSFDDPLDGVIYPILAVHLSKPSFAMLHCGRDSREDCQVVSDNVFIFLDELVSFEIIKYEELRLVLDNLKRDKLIKKDEDVIRDQLGRATSNHR